MDEIRISIIIPAYNAASLLPAALDSLVHQEVDFPFEVLVEDDGSTDDTSAVIARFSAQYPFISGETIPNSGPAGARNAALARARGRYILFCDADDAFLPGALAHIAAEMERSGCDFLIFGFLLTDEEGRESRPYHHAPALLSSPEKLGESLASLYGANMLNQVWAKGFRRELIEQNALRFPIHSWGEDRLFVFDYIEKCSTVLVDDGCFYDYRQQKGSLISAYVAEKLEICTEIDARIRAYAASLASLSPEAEELYHYMYLKSVLSCFSMLFSPKCPLSHREKRRYIRAALANPALRACKAIPRNAGRAFSILQKILLSGNVSLNLFAAWGMNFAQKHLSSLFRRAKHAYNKE